MPCGDSLALEDAIVDLRASGRSIGDKVDTTFGKKALLGLRLFSSPHPNPRRVTRTQVEMDLAVFASLDVSDVDPALAEAKWRAEGLQDFVQPAEEDGENEDPEEEEPPEVVPDELPERQLGSSFQRDFTSRCMRFMVARSLGMSWAMSNARTFNESTY